MSNLCLCLSLIGPLILKNRTLISGQQTTQDFCQNGKVYLLMFYSPFNIGQKSRFWCLQPSLVFMNQNNHPCSMMIPTNIKSIMMKIQKWQRKPFWTNARPSGRTPTNPLLRAKNRKQKPPSEDKLWCKSLQVQSLWETFTA